VTPINTRIKADMSLTSPATERGGGVNCRRKSAFNPSCSRDNHRVNLALRPATVHTGVSVALCVNETESGRPWPNDSEATWRDASPASASDSYRANFAV